MAVKVLTKAEVERLLAAPDQRSRYGRRDRAFLAVMTLGGLRIAEACNLRRDVVETSGGVTRLTFTGKGGKLRTVTLPSVAAEAVHRTLKDFHSEYIFVGRCHSRPLTTQGGRWIAKQHFKSAGFDAWVHPHSLRHTCASALMRSTGDLHMVQRVLGHSSPATTAKHYLAWDTSDADKAAHAMESIFNG